MSEESVKRVKCLIIDVKKKTIFMCRDIKSHFEICYLLSNMLNYKRVKQKKTEM